MTWLEIMGFPLHAPSTIGGNLKISEGFGWLAAILSMSGVIHGLTSMVASLSPDQINPWLILIASGITGGVAVGTIVYSRILRTKLDGETMEAIYRANNDAIRSRQPIPFPAFLPKEALGTQVYDVSAKETTPPSHRPRPRPKPVPKPAPEPPEPPP